jgi:FMN phosphatase YigB (HAD superfamily)
MIKVVIFDYNWTIYDPIELALFPEALQVLADLIEKDYKLVLISKTENVEVRREEIKNLGLDELFEIIDIVPEEREKEFEWIFEELEVKADQVLVVGDNVKSEIAVGNSTGCMTVWVPRGEFAHVLPKTKEEKPDFTVKDLTGVSQILNSL